MFSKIKNIFNNKNKELELRERELELKVKEIALKEKELFLSYAEKRSDNYYKEKLNENEKVFKQTLEEKENEFNQKFNTAKNEEPITKPRKGFREYTEEEKKEYALKMKEKKEKGKEYEEFVAGYYKLNGYEIYLHGIKKGKKDKGIDIICSKDEELILIQCKNWKEDSKYKINHEKLKAFVGCCTEYVNEHKLFDKKVKLKFITSNYILDESGKKFLEESKTLQYEILKF
jgi:Holliday junction resolvase